MDLEAELDYILESEKGEWIIGFLDSEGNPYECPHTTNAELIKKLDELDRHGLANRLRVNVEINEKLDRYHKQYPTLIDVKAIDDDF
jgi:hypothetical protein